ncbi:helix-turn-helix domain-containing protein [Chitinophaga silvatica]|uniref:Helix-turn-helix domain-containing protein n=1 Tax=Chitinophaga silvatica TaxID=2282649 RepID=A0A3E1YAV9_9BACT|nr:helix-turn-helix domain-containing protein [Chitinophaga silvatica]RFS22797.1 helix-turn-helix domain-containing protein [Chitinophaga silvatica]
MHRNQNNDHIPILGMQEFAEPWTADHGIQYHELKGAREIAKAHKHDFFIFLLFETGSGTHTIDFIEYKIGAQQVHLVFPGQVHKWRFGAKTHAHQLMISRSLFESFSSAFRFSLNQYANNPVINPGKAFFSQLLYETLAIRKEAEQKNIVWELIRARNEVIALIVSKAAEKKFTHLNTYHTNPFLNKFISLIDQHFKEEHAVSFYAKQLNITPNYLNILCRKNLHVSATYLIQNRAILEAKRLLQVSELSVKEIAFELGFYDHAYFSKFFKSQTGSTPTEFRQQ